jgi:transcriptional regulator with XRE-family HTH domain
MENGSNKLGEIIRAQMLVKNMSLMDVAKASKGQISDAYISQLITGKAKNPSVRKIRALAEALGLEAARLLELL